MERRPNRRQTDILPFGNDPQQLSLSAEGRRVLKKAIVDNMSQVWGQVGKIPQPEIERLGNGILGANLPRKQLVEMHDASQKLIRGLKLSQ